MKIDKHVFRRADFIERSLENLRKALRNGAIVVALFVMNVRAAFSTLPAMSIFELTGVLTMNWFGFTLNSMSLGGLAIAIGEWVDGIMLYGCLECCWIRSSKLGPVDALLLSIAEGINGRAGRKSKPHRAGNYTGLEFGFSSWSMVPLRTNACCGYT